MVLVESSAQLRLADVLVSCWRAVSGQPNPLGLSTVSKAAVLVVDGMGAHNLRAHSGHARFLSQAWRQRDLVADSGFPSTTASALTALTTGQLAGIHGIAGYTLRDPVSGNVINHLKEWRPSVDPDTWQRSHTIFEAASSAGVPSLALGEPRFHGSDFTEATWRGARFEGVLTLADQARQMRKFFDHHERGLVYLYWPALDRTGHSSGVNSESWIHRLEELDRAVQELSGVLKHDEGLVVTSDHGMVDIPDENKFIVEEDSPLLAGLQAWAGEPRAPHLYFESADRALIAKALWQEALGEKARVLTRQELVDSQWLGDVHPDVALRLGDLVIVCVGDIVIYRRSQSSPMSLAMRGQHGSITALERDIPVIPLGAWA